MPFFFPKRQREGHLLLVFRRNLERVVLKQRSLEGNQTYKWWFLTGCEAGQYVTAGVQEDLPSIFFFFFEAEDEIPMWKVSSVIKIIPFCLLPAGHSGCNEWSLPENSSFRVFQFKWGVLCLFSQPLDLKGRTFSLHGNKLERSLPVVALSSSAEARIV